MTPHLRIQLLGEFRLLLDDLPVTSVNQRRQQALLAYLLLHRHAPQSRQYVAYQFWPDSSESQAHTNLRKLVFMLRESLPAADFFIRSDSQSIEWQQEAPYSLDVAELEAALEELERSTVALVATVQRVLPLYPGELLLACYEEWLLPIRRTLHERVVKTLTKAIADLESQHEYPTALRAAEHLLHLDPLHETAYRHLMQLRMLSGDRAGALRAYHECFTVLEQELEVAPTAETQALYQHLLNYKGQSATPSSPASAQRHEHVPLIGRRQEWQTLQQAWHQMARYGPQLVAIWGEAGVGKTRLVEELLHWASLRPGTVAFGRAYAAEGSLSYSPLTEWLHSEALQPVLAQLEPLWQTELSRILPEWLTTHPDLPPPVAMSEVWQRQRFYEALARTIVASPSPRLLLLDDLQWCDVETLAWLRYLMRFDPQAPLLIVGTVRYEAVDEEHPLRDLLQQLQRAGQYREVELAPLSIEETALLAGHLTDKDVTNWATQLYEETEGNPLFVVEMVRAGIIERQNYGQKGGHEEQTTVLPPTIQGVIAARLEQLSTHARQLAQLAATVGRAFTIEVLAAASKSAEDLLIQALDELWQRRIVRERGDGYDFSHDKIREVAYAAVSPMRRRLLHRQVADGLEQLHAQQLSEVAGVLAAHYTQAGETEKALTYLVLAGDRAKRLSANHEALHYYQQAIALTHTSTHDPELAKERQKLILARRARIYLDLYQGKQAIDDYQYVLQHARDIGNRQHELEFMLGLAKAYYVVALDNSETDAALQLRDLYLATQRMARELGDQHKLVRSLLLPIWHLWPDLLAQSIGNVKEAFALSCELDDEELIIESKLALLHSASEAEQASIGAELVSQLQERHDLDRLNQSYNYLMWIHYHLGDFHHMIAVCDAGIAVAAKLGVPPVVYPTLKAFAMLRLGRYGKAWEALQQEVADEAHLFGRTFKETGIGMYLSEVGAYTQAAAILEEAMMRAKWLRRGWLAEWARIHFVHCLIRVAQPNGPAWTRATQILAAADQNVLLGLKPWQAQMLTLQAEIALAEGQPEKALHLCHNVCALVAANGYQAYLVSAWELEARILLQLQRPADALARLDEALQLSSQLESLPLTWRLEAVKAQALVKVGQAHAAEVSWAKAAATIQTLAASIHDRELQQGFLSEPRVAATLKR